MATETAQKRSMTMWYVVAAIIIIVVIVAGVVLYEQSLAPPGGGGGGTPIALTLYEGEVNSTDYGFGDSASSLSSPGPTLTLTQGQSYKMTVYNVGALPHSWEIASTNTGTPSPLFNSEINPGAYIAGGGSGSVTFTPNQSGNFYYVCPVPGHTDLGMWGNVVINAG
jgi:uncharacterized cupredoxin-like copper-binding protein